MRNIAVPCYALLALMFATGSGFAQPVPEAAPTPTRAFGDLTPIDTPADFPYRVACKVISTFPTTGTVEGSGILIGPKHVLTSGVYVHFDGEWADTVEVIPGLDGDTRPYGSSFHEQLYAWANWIVSTDYNDNLGLILLERPLGAIVGYHQFAGEDDDSFFTSTNFNILGYPFSSPANGTQLNLWFGSFDSVDGNSLGFEASPQPGMGGGGVYIRNGSTDIRTVYGVFSHTVGSTVYAVRITETRATGIQTTINDALSETPDLMALHMTGAGPTVRQGDTLEGLSFTLYNDASATFDAGVVATTYLSTNSAFTELDTAVAGPQAGVIALGPEESLEVALNLATIPRTTTPGSYFLGVIAEAEDGTPGNNGTNGAEALPIEIVPRYHTADIDETHTLALSELLRVIQFFNSGAIYCQPGTEDGYSPTPGDQVCPNHESDYDPANWVIELNELLRAIQFFNSGGYTVCEGTEDGYCPGL